MPIGSTDHADLQLYVSANPNVPVQIEAKSGSFTDTWDAYAIRCEPVYTAANNLGAVVLTPSGTPRPEVTVGGEARPVETADIPGIGLTLTFIPGDRGEKAHLRVHGVDMTLTTDLGVTGDDV